MTTTRRPPRPPRRPRAPRQTDHSGGVPAAPRAATGATTRDATSRTNPADAPPAPEPAITPARRRRPGPRPAAPRDTRLDVFHAAAELFSVGGFDGVGVDDIARAAGANKAMIYYHFEDKLALYREIVRDMLRAVGAMATAVAGQPAPADERLAAFVAGMLDMAHQRPWFPPLMLREIAEGAPRLDADTLGLMKVVFLSFGRILTDGHRAGLFRPVNPVLAYMSTLGPLLLNAARERAAARPGRRDLPMFAEVPRHELVVHMQQSALRLLSLEPGPA